MSDRDPHLARTEWDRLQEQRAAEEKARFPAFVWVGLLLLIATVGAIGVYAFREQLGLVSVASPTPRIFATPPPAGTPTPLPTPAPVAWLWVDCEPSAPCADQPALREEMASFLSRGLELTPITDDDAFSDIADSAYRGEINALAAAGLTAGCGGASFCPNGNVTRAEMAAFLQRAFPQATTTRDFFDDDEDSQHEAAINALAAAGVATPCGQRLYCPADLVTREELAGYLSRAVDQ